MRTYHIHEIKEMPTSALQLITCSGNKSWSNAASKELDRRKRKSKLTTELNK